MGAREIVTNLIAHDKASKPIKDVGDAAGKSALKVEQLSAAEQRLALEVEKAGLRVEKATKAAANAEERYGRESIQAREATLRLKAAEHDLADAAEKVKHKTEAAAHAQGEMARKALEAAAATEEADKKTDGLHKRMLGMLPTMARHASGLSLLTMGARSFGTAMASALPALARVSAWVGAFGSSTLTVAPIIGAFAAKVGAAAVEFGHFAAAVAPAAASLPGLAAGFLFAKATIGLAAPGIVKGLRPITEAFTGTPGKVNGKKGMIGGLQTQLQDLASRGLPAVSRSFLRVNFPTIAVAMDRIAKATNGVVLTFGRWANSLSGQLAVKAVVEGTAQAVVNLGPHISRLAIAFGNLIRRASPVAFYEVSVGLGKVADAASRFVDGISRSDVQKAWTRIEGFGGAVRGVVPHLRALGSLVAGGVRWWRENSVAIGHARDVLGLVAIAAGVATGAWIPALIAGVSLLISHWDQVTSVLGRVRTWFHGTSQSAQGVREVIGGLQAGVGDLVSWFRDQLLPAFERAAHAVMPAIQTAVRMVTNTFHENRAIIGQVQGVLRAVGIVITEAVIPAVTFLAKIAIAYLGTEISVLIWLLQRVFFPALKDLVGIVLDVFGAIVHGASAALGWVPGLGPKLHAAARQFDKFRDQVNNALGGIKDQHVTVGATIGFTTGKGTASAGKKAGFFARGGPVVGPGGPRDDMVPLWGSNGEFMVNAKQTARHRPLLEAINAGRYRDGGLIVDTQTNGLAQTMAAERKALLAAAKRMAPSFSAGSVGHIGGGVRQWAGLVAQVLAELGQPASALGPVLSRMQRESGGNPRAINLTDSNARAGDPSRGLLQTIGSTFNAFAGPYRGAGIYDPHANIYAGINYAIHRYGSHWISRMLAPGGYDQGGWLPPGRHMVENRTGRPEPVFSPRQWDTLRAVVRQGGHSHTSSSTVNVTVEVTASAAAIQDRIEEAVRRGVSRGRFSTAVLPPGTR